MELTLQKILNEVVSDMTNRGILHEDGGDSGPYPDGMPVGDNPTTAKELIQQQQDELDAIKLQDAVDAAQRGEATPEQKFLVTKAAIKQYAQENPFKVGIGTGAAIGLATGAGAMALRKKLREVNR